MKTKIKRLPSLLLLFTVSGHAAITTPNMGLSIPQVGDTNYPTSISNSFTLIDTHDHSAGKGVVLGTNAVPGAAIQNNAVTTAKILDLSVTTAKLADLSVTTGKLADLSVATAKIIDANVTTAKIQDGAVTQAKLAARTTGTTVAAGGVAISNSSGSFTTASTAAVDVTNLSVTITTTGRPVYVGVIPDGTASPFSVFCAFGAFQYFIVRNSSAIASFRGAVFSSGTATIPPQLAGATNTVDIVAAGTHTYKIQTRNEAGGSTVNFLNAKIIAFEL